MCDFELYQDLNGCESIELNAKTAQSSPSTHAPLVLKIPEGISFYTTNTFCYGLIKHTSRLKELNPDIWNVTGEEVMARYWNKKGWVYKIEGGAKTGCKVMELGWETSELENFKAPFYLLTDLVFSKENLKNLAWFMTKHARDNNEPETLLMGLGLETPASLTAEDFKRLQYLWGYNARF